MKLEEGACAWSRNGREGSDIGRIAAGVSNGDGEMAMLRAEGTPYRICEEVFW